MLRRSYAFALVSCCTVLLASGCTLGPRQIQKGRLHYNDAIQRTFQEEMLLNLVRLKYREIPEFLTVGAVAAQYSFDGSAGAGLTIPEGALDILSFNGAVARSEKPTISYVPARGEEFQKGLLAPIDIQSLELLARTGWRWDRLLRTTVQYLNEIDNATSAGGPTPAKKPEYEEFRYLAHHLRQLQLQRQIEMVVLERDTCEKVPLPLEQLDGVFVINALKEGYTFKHSDKGLTLVKDEQFVALVVHPDAKSSQEMAEVARLLGLHVDYDSPKPAIYKLDLATEGQIYPKYETFASRRARDRDLDSHGVERLPPPNGFEPVPLSTGREDIVVSTRSLLEVMFYLSQGISIPHKHVEAGLVTVTLDEDGNAFNWEEMTGDLLRVHSCKQRPKTAAIAVKFKGHWFYIDDRDLNSQSTFMLLVELFGIEVRAGGGGGFLYTLSVGG